MEKPNYEEIPFFSGGLHQKVNMRQHPKVPSYAEDEPEVDQFLSDAHSSEPNVFDCVQDQQLEEVEKPFGFRAQPLPFC